MRVRGAWLAEAGYRTGLVGKLGAKPIKRVPFDSLQRTNGTDVGARSLGWHVVLPGG